MSGYTNFIFSAIFYQFEKVHLHTGKQAARAAVHVAGEAEAEAEACFAIRQRLGGDKLFFLLQPNVTV